MTVTPPRERARRRGLRTRATAIIGMLAVAVIPMLAPVAAGAATPTPTPQPAVPAGVETFTLSPVGGGVVRPGERLTVSVTLQNGTDLPIAPASVTLALGASPLPDREALTGWLAGDTSGVATADVGTGAIDAVLPGGTQVAGIGVEAESPALQNREPGVYPLLATYQGSEGPVTSASAMIVPDDGAEVVGIGVVVPITAEGLSEGLLTRDQLIALTTPTGSLSTQLNAVEGTSAILAVDPAIPASIRVLGTSAPASALEWLARLDDLPQSRFPLQFGDADVAVQVEAGLSRPLAPTSLSFYMSPANFVPTTEPTPQASPGPTPTPAVDPDAPVYPDLATLLDIGGGRAGVFWPVAGTAAPETLATLGRVTVDDRASLTLVPSAATVEGANGATVAAHGHVGDADVLVYDTAVSHALQQASRTDENALRGAALTEATAYLAFASTETDGAPLLVALDRDTARDRVGLRSAITTATQAPGFTPLTLGRLASSDAHEVGIADAAADPARVATTSALLADETALSRFATILDDTSLITGPERAELLQLLGIAWIAEPDAWSAAIASHRQQTAATLDSVDLLPTSTINLFGADADLGFWVRNDLPYPVNLVLYATPSNLRLDVQPATPLVAGASSNTRVEVPVQARIGNGEVTLALQLRSRASVAIGEGTTVQVNVRAEWEGVGIIALSVVVGGLLILGVVRTVLRMRARRKARAGGGEHTDPGETVEGETAEGETADTVAPTDPEAGE
jgi:hypothetical protein